MSFSACLFLILSACDDTEEEQIATGSWYGDVFINEHSGLQFQIPNSWRAFTDEESLEFERFIDRGPLSTTRQEIGQLGINGEFINDMIAVNLSATEESIQVIIGRLDPEARNRQTTDALEIMFNRLPHEVSRYTALDLLDMIRGNMLLAEIRNATIYQEPVLIGRYEFFMMQTTVETIFGIRVPRRIYLNVDEEDVRIIIATAQTSQQIDVRMSLFDVIGTSQQNAGDSVIFNRAFEVLEAADLIGNWTWDSNHDFSYVFEGDGTGIRGFSTNMQTFEWTFFEGVLALYVNLTGYSSLTELW